MTAPPLPDIARVLALPSYFEQVVGDEAIDENLHMNISDYFRVGVWAPWIRLGELGLGEHYIPDRGLSFFTVEHHIRYLSELRLGERYSVHVAFAGRTEKAMHGVSFVVDRERDVVACVLEIMYVHVSMETRRSVAMPEDVAAAVDAEIATMPWVAPVATGLSLRR